MKVSFFLFFFVWTVNYCLAQKLPIKPYRTLSIPVSEGSYMNIDVSHNGNMLVFDLLGDLYSMPVQGGQATQITRGMALNLRPVWSLDDKKIAFISDISGSFHLNILNVNEGHSITLDPGGASINYGSEPVWSPDGNFVAINDSVYGLIGGKVAVPLEIKRPIKFSLDGNYVYYVNSGGIFKYDLNTKLNTSISSQINSLGVPVLSNDEHWLAYLSNIDGRRSLLSYDLINKKERVLVEGIFLKDSKYEPGTPSQHFSFSPDSKYIYIGYGGKIHKINLESGNNEIIPFNVTAKVDVGYHNYNKFSLNYDSVRVKYIRSVSKSPNGKSIVFSALGKVYFMDLAIGNPYLLTNQTVNQFQPSFSPDGKWISYVSWCDSIGGFLWRVSQNGGDPKLITTVPGHYQRATWSPDGKYIAVVKGMPVLNDRDDPGKGELLLISTESKKESVIDKNVPLWNQIEFSNDGRRIFYEPALVDNSDTLISQIVSSNLDGSQRKVEATGATIGSPRYYQQRSISPNGKYIVYSMGEDLYLVPVEQLNNPPVIYNKNIYGKAIRFAQGVDPEWKSNGRILSWNYANHYYEVNPERIIINAQQQYRHLNSLDSSIITILTKPELDIKINLSVPADYAKGAIVIKGVRILPMKGNQIIEDGTIVIQNGRFVAVGPSSKVNIPNNAKVYSFPGKTIIPGFIDLHSHIRVSPDVFPQQLWMYLCNLAYGVTTIRDPSLSFDSFGYEELLRSGRMTGPRLFTVGRSVNPSFGIRCNNLDEARAIVNKRKLMGGTAIKQYTLPTRFQRQLLLMASIEAGLNMTNEGNHDPILQIGMFKDGSSGVEHNPEWGDVYSDVISFVAATGSYLTPALQVCYGKEGVREYFNYKYWHASDEKLNRFTSESRLQRILNTVPADSVTPEFLYPSQIDALIRKHGGNVTLGSHGEDQGIGVHNELWALQAGGISNMEALQAATIMGAHGIGIQKDLGSIEVGKIADLIILNSNPLDDIHNSRDIKCVMKNGILYEADSLREIWPEPREMPLWRMRDH